MIVLYMTLLLAVCDDLKRFKISNAWIILGYLSGIIYLLFFQTNFQIQVLVSHLLGAFCTLFFLYPLKRWKVLGGGDIKLFSVIILFVTDLTEGFSILILSILLGGILSVGLILRAFFISKWKREPFSFPRYIHFSIPIFLATLFWHLGSAKLKAFFLF